MQHLANLEGFRSKTNMSDYLLPFTIDLGPSAYLHVARLVPGQY